MLNFHYKSGLEKVPISPWLVTLLHICGVIPTPQSPSRYLRKLRVSADVSALSADIVALNGEYFMVFHNVLRVLHDYLLVVHDVLLVVHDVSECFISVSWCFTMFNNVLWVAQHLSSLHRPLITTMPQGSAIIPQGFGDDAAGIVDIAANMIPC